MKVFLFVSSLFIFLPFLCEAATSDYVEPYEEDMIIYDMPSATNSGWFTINSDFIFDLSADVPFFNNKNIGAYTLGITAGSNFAKYFGFQSSFFYTPSLSSSMPNSFSFDLMLIVQKNMNPRSFGFRPYAGLGVAAELTDIGRGGMLYGFGLATEAGVRFFYKKFLAGLSVNYNLYYADNLGDSYYYNIYGTHSNIKTGINIGFIF